MGAKRVEGVVTLRWVLYCASGADAPQLLMKIQIDDDGVVGDDGDVDLDRDETLMRDLHVQSYHEAEVRL